MSGGNSSRPAFFAWLSTGNNTSPQGEKDGWDENSWQAGRAGRNMGTMTSPPAAEGRAERASPRRRAVPPPPGAGVLKPAHTAQRRLAADAGCSSRTCLWALTYKNTYARTHCRALHLPL